MEDELGSPRPKKRHRSDKRQKEIESTLNPQSSDNISKSPSKKQNLKASKKEDSLHTTHKAKNEKADKKDQLTDSMLIPNEESSNELVLEYQSVPTINQIVGRVGQLESHMTVLTNSIAELQRNQSKILKQLKTIEKRWSVVREAWAGQPNQNKRSTSYKEKKDDLEGRTKKKKKPKKNKCKKKKDNLLNSKASPVVTSSGTSSPTPPQQPDTSENSSFGSGEQDLNKRIRAVLANIMYERPMLKK